MNDTPAKQSSAPFAFTRWEVFEPLRRHGAFIRLFTLSAALSALLLTYAYSEMYEAESTIILKPTDVVRLQQHDIEALGAPVPQLEYKIIGQTMKDLVESDPILRQVVVKLHLDAPEPRDYSGPFYYRWYKESKDWLSDEGSDAWSILKYGRIIDDDPTDSAVTTLRKNLSIDSEDSYVFELKVRDKHPDRVGAIANEIGQVVIGMLRNSQQTPAQTRSLELRGRLGKKYGEIQTAEEKISNLLNASHTASIQEEIDKGTGQYVELRTSWLDLQSQIQQQRATIAAYDVKLKGSSNPAPGEQRLQSEDFKKMMSDRLNAQLSLVGLEHKSASLGQSLLALHTRLQELPQMQVQYDLLENNRERAQHDYSLINDALQETILEQQNSVTALAVAGPAATSNSPATPIKIYHVSLATGLALLLSIGIAFVLGYFEVELFMSPERPRNEPSEDTLPSAPMVSALHGSEAGGS
jgi:uncharacterized protein involved in exopolysaccharide biosynthesis